MQIKLTVPGGSVNERVLQTALEAATAVAETQVATGRLPDIREVIEAGAVKWRPEPVGQGYESFDIPSQVLARGHGDCDDLAPWLAGQLRVTGEDPGARAIAYRSGPKKWHAVVQLSDGNIADPSVWAGMLRHTDQAMPIEQPMIGVGKAGLKWKQMDNGSYVARLDAPCVDSPYGVSVRESSSMLVGAIDSAARSALFLGALYGTMDPNVEAKLHALRAMMRGASLDQVQEVLGIDAHRIGAFIPAIAAAVSAGAQLAPVMSQLAPQLANQMASIDPKAKAAAAKVAMAADLVNKLSTPDRTSADPYGGRGRVAPVVGWDVWAKGQPGPPPKKKGPKTRAGQSIDDFNKAKAARGASTRAHATTRSQYEAQQKADADAQAQAEQDAKDEAKAQADFERQMQLMQMQMQMQQMQQPQQAPAPGYDEGDGEGGYFVQPEGGWSDEGGGADWGGEGEGDFLLGDDWSRTYGPVSDDQIASLITGARAHGVDVTGSNPWSFDTHQHGVTFSAAKHDDGRVLVHVTGHNFYVPASKIWDKVDALMSAAGASVAGVGQDLMEAAGVGAAPATAQLRHDVHQLRAAAANARKSPAHEAAAYHVAMTHMADGLARLASVANQQASMASGVLQAVPDDADVQQYGYDWGPYADDADMAELADDWGY